MNNSNNEIVVSYAWGGESECIVDELEQAFAQRGIHVVRDKKDLAYKGSIEEFEQRIGQGKCIVLVISDKYLRSEHCMFELVEAGKNENLRARIFPIVLADAQIYKAIDRISYINYWDEQIRQLDQAIKGVRVGTNLSSFTANLDKYESIRARFDRLTNLLVGMNALTPDEHATKGFSTLIHAVEYAMERTKTISINGFSTVSNLAKDGKNLTQSAPAVTLQVQAGTTQVTLNIEAKFEEFTPNNLQYVTAVIAALFKIRPDEIKILGVSNEH